MYYIGAKDLIANAMIEKLLRNETDNFLSCEEIKKYGNAIASSLIEDGEEIILDLSREKFQDFLYDYSDYFEEVINGDKSGIYAKIFNQQTVKNFIFQFRQHTALNLLIKFTDVNIIEKTLIIEDEQERSFVD